MSYDVVATHSLIGRVLMAGTSFRISRAAPDLTGGFKVNLQFCWWIQCDPRSNNNISTLYLRVPWPAIYYRDPHHLIKDQPNTTRLSLHVLHSWRTPKKLRNVSSPSFCLIWVWNELTPTDERYTAVSSFFLVLIFNIYTRSALLNITAITLEMSAIQNWLSDYVSNFIITTQAINLNWS